MAEIVSTSISDGWLKAVSLAMRSSSREVCPLTVIIQSGPSGAAVEDPRVREALDAHLRTRGTSVETVSNTIFPHSLWNPDRPRRELFDRYRNILSRIRSHARNRRGVYFERFISYPGTRGGAGQNQLDHILSTYAQGNHRRSALQLGVFVPRTDLNNARQMGFPCLQQVAFTPDSGRGTLGVTGFYAMQYLFTRAYGNYCGLLRLGAFVAHELDLRLGNVMCIAATAHLDAPVRVMRQTFGKYISECEKAEAKIGP